MLKSALSTLISLSFLTALAAAVDADAYHKSVMTNRGIVSTKQPGEQYAWIAAYCAGPYIKAYKAYGDEKWVKNAIEFFDYYLARNTKDPDGYYGTFGAGFDNQKTEDFQYRWDTVVGDAIECMYIVRLAEIIKNDPALYEKYGDKANEYIAYADKMCYEKWDKRGCYYEDAAGYGSYHTYDKQLDPKTNKWVLTSNKVISDNLNKHYDMCMVFVCLYRITGDEKYKKRVQAIMKRAKAMFRSIGDEDNRIVWNFWMPHGPHDLEGTSPKSWVGVHSSRPGYQISEVGFFIEIYDSGLVFEKSDFERMIKTNLWMKKQGYKVSADGTSKAGGLWTGFTRFNDELYDDYLKRNTKTDMRNQIERDYVKKMKKIGWKRQYVKKQSDVEVYDFDVQDGKHITLAVAIPNTVETINNDRVKLLAQLRANKKYTVTLLDENKKSLGELHSEDYKVSGGGYKTILWDGTNPKTGKKKNGSYFVKFTLGNESRMWPVVVKKGVKKAKKETFVLAKGKDLKEDFESKLNTEIWKLEGGAKVVDGKGRDGSKALSLSSGHTARLFFGEFEDLKVKVSFWAYDEGVKKGKGNGTGGKWGVQMSTGNKFVIAQMWRRYLSGDSMYNWMNNGENQWFNIHPAYLKRRMGWNHFTFDFTGDGLAKITCNDEVMQENRMKPHEFIPKGAIAAFFEGPGHNTGTLLIDDLEITYP